MKKLLIVCDNMHVGGIQKSLVNFLNACRGKYDIALLLLFPKGLLLKEIPSDVKLLTPCFPLRVLGAYRSDLKKNPLAYAWKAFLVLLARFFTKKAAFLVASVVQKKLGTI